MSRQRIRDVTTLSVRVELRVTLTCRPTAVAKFLCGVVVGLGFDGGGWECPAYANGSCPRVRMIDLRRLPTSRRPRLEGLETRGARLDLSLTEDILANIIS